MKQQCGFNTQLKADDQHLQPLTTVKFPQITISDRSATAGVLCTADVFLFVENSFFLNKSHQKTLHLPQEKSAIMLDPLWQKS